MLNDREVTHYYTNIPINMNYKNDYINVYTVLLSNVPIGWQSTNYSAVSFSNTLNTMGQVVAFFTDRENI